MQEGTARKKYDKALQEWLDAKPPGEKAVAQKALQKAGSPEHEVQQSIDKAACYPP